ncbi:MAG: hypothetical protein C4K58_06130 [Flavobacteriaceae bacterium]|nr:MAG: hypothetical protein C4K58_06130 [Flavobacteriaceae bacterium]
MPNAAILKAGSFKSITKEYEVFKIDTNSHLYTSIELLEDFPGKGYEILEKVENLKSIAKQSFQLVVRNYPLNIHKIKAKYKLSEGGDKVLIFTTERKKPVVYKARRCL